ncbi:MAG: sigma-E factor negative regulatory protein [Burkholderiales bacterium]|jgi:sigma-E factor negative regulatory protein RseA|nr:sigma-E factor negative regulatory protein [Burkholderiales bacterium]
MKENLSAMLDGELDSDAAGRVCGRLREDAELRETWEAYALIGDALRGTAATGMSREAFAARLASEPTVLAPRAAPAVRPAMRATRYALSAAAGLAAVGFVGWMALPALQGPGVDVARAPVAAPQETAVVAATVAAPVVPAAQGVSDYLLAHQRFSPAFAMQGVAPYVRTVADEQAGGR